MTEASLLEYWLQLPSKDATLALKKLSIFPFEVIPPEAGVKGLFSTMSETTTKNHNCMIPNTLCMVSPVKLNLIQNSNNKAIGSSKNQTKPLKFPTLREYDFMNSYDSFVLPDELADLEAGIFHEVSNEMQISHCNALMASLFDFNLLDQTNNDSTEERALVEVENDDWEIEVLL
ncbi:hypothetical protein O181_027028 [Austropuccinia psidii MF-1]|uniref:Uncharacterized protein n=1 Tax=Austropuccinia psidii MF-1 TaxID=1389203 RepID=A0A9Q3H0J7_9BASI|nr:hypothetical protein [Austropuccinia psidii MF-1]